MGDFEFGSYDFDSLTRMQEEEERKRKEEKERREYLEGIANVAGSIPGEVNPDEITPGRALTGLNETLGGILGAAKKPVDYIASRGAGLEETRPAEELLTNALFPKLYPADISGTPTEFGEGGEVTESAPATPEEIKHSMIANTIARKVTESAGGLALNPATYAIPGSKLVGAMFLPGVAEGLGTGLGTGIAGLENEDPEAAAGGFTEAGINALFGGMLAKHLGSSGGPHATDTVTEGIETPRAETVSPDLQAPSKMEPLPDFIKKDIAAAKVSHPSEAPAQEFVNNIKQRVADVTGSDLGDIKVVADPTIDTAHFNPETGEIRYNPETTARNPREISDTILHELSHATRGIEEGDISKHGTSDIGVVPGEEGNVGIVRTGGETIAETDPNLVEHTEANQAAREKIVPKDIHYGNVRDILEHDPEVWKHREAFENSVGKVEEPLSDIGPPVEGVIREDLQAPPKEEIPKGEEDITIPTEGLVTETPPPSENVISEPANILRKILSATKSTRFNKSTLVADLKAKGIDVPPEVASELPNLLGELKGRGWVNEKVGGTYTLNIEPPKTSEKIFKKPEVKTTTPGRNLEETLKASITPKTPKTPNLEAKMGEKLTKDEIAAIGKLFGGESKKVVPEGLGKELVRQAKESAEKKIVKPKESKGEEVYEEVTPTEEGPKKSYSVTLSDGTSHRIRAESPEAAKIKAEKILTSKGSSKTVDKIEESLTSLERAAKYETEPVKEGTEKIKDIEAGIKGTKKEEIKLSREEERLRRAQTKEKFDKLSFIVKLSNGKKVNVRARNVDIANQMVKDHIAKSGSDVKVDSIHMKPSALETAVEGGGKGKPPTNEPPKFGRDSVTPEDSFSQAWNKLSPTEKVGEVMGMVKAMRSSGDLGHMLRQGKLMTVDFLTTGNAKELVNAIKTMKESAFSEKKFNDTNEAHMKDKVTSRLVEEFGLDLPGVAGHLKEEAFHASLAEKVPGLGKVLIKPSERAYTSFLNEARVSEAKRIIGIAEDAGFTMDKDPEVYRSMMKAVNIISSRGDFKKIGPTLNKLSNLMWAPRLKLSRMQLLSSALGGGEMHPFARAELRKSLGRTAAVNMSLLGLAALAGANVETDPRNSDWGKIKVKDTRIDPWFGLQPIVRSVLLLHYGERISPTSGAKYKTNPPEIIGNQIMSGIAPGPAYGWEQMTGKNVGGYPINRGERAILGVSPLVVEDVYDAFRKYGLMGAVAVTPLSELGEGVNTFRESDFGKSKSKKKSKKKKSVFFD